MRKILFTTLLLFTCFSASAQMSQFQALYIYNFCRNTSWASEDAGRSLIITVIGDKNVESELSKLAQTKKIGSRKIEVKSAASAQSIPNSDVVFLAETQSGQIGSLMNAVRGTKTLVISGKKGHCSAGAGISFVSDGGKLNYQISSKNIAKNGLSVSQKIITLGTDVD